MEYKIIIDGDTWSIDTVRQLATGVAEIEDGQTTFIVADSRDRAGEYARERWEDMAKHDRKEFACLIGEERLVGWALGESDNFGISSLEEFLDAIEGSPEEELAGYDSAERDVDGRGRDQKSQASSRTTVTEDFEYELGFQPLVAYRSN